MERISGETSSRADGSSIDSHMEMSAGRGVEMDFEPASGFEGGMDRAADRAHDVADQARDRMDDVRERAGSLADDARRRAGDVLDMASSRLEDSGALEMVRNNPLPALGIAFGVGFLLAGSSDTGGRVGKAKQQVKGAVLGGLSAALTQQVRELVDSQGGAKGLMDSLMGGQRDTPGSSARF